MNREFGKKGDLTNQIFERIVNLTNRDLTDFYSTKELPQHVKNLAARIYPH